MSPKFRDCNGLCDPLFISFLLPLSFRSLNQSQRASGCEAEALTGERRGERGRGYLGDQRWGTCKETPWRGDFAREPAPYPAWPALSIRLLTLMDSSWSSEYPGILSLQRLMPTLCAGQWHEWELLLLWSLAFKQPVCGHNAYRSGLSAITPFTQKFSPSVLSPHQPVPSHLWDPNTTIVPPVSTF